MTCANLHMLGIPEGEETEKRIKNVFAEIMTENFPNLKKETDIQVQEPKKPTQSHIIIKKTKVKYEERSLRAPRRKTKNIILSDLITWMNMQ